MFEAENIRDWRGHDVVDADGHKIGELVAEDEEAVFKHYGLEYQPGAGGERRLGRR